MPYKVTATDICGNTVSDSVHLTLNFTLHIVSMNATVASSCEDNGTTSAVVAGTTGAVSYNWSGPGSQGSVVSTAISASDLTDGWYYLTVVDNVCAITDSIYVDRLNPVTAIFSIASVPGEAPQTIAFSNSSQNADTYYWDFGNGEELTVNDLSNQSSEYASNGVYSVTLRASKGIARTA